MLTPSKKVLTFSNVKWIDNIIPPVIPSESSKRQRLSLSITPIQENNISDDFLTIPTLTETMTISDTQDSLVFSPTSSLSSVPSSLPSRAPSISPPVHVPLRAVTRQLAKEIRSKHLESQETPQVDSLSLLFLLSTANSPEPSEPKTYKETTNKKNDYRKDWRKAMQEEINFLNENETWIITNLPVGSVPLDGKWVYKIKRGPNGEINRYKARWVVRGFQQREEIDYHETFASVVKPMSYKAIFAIAAAHDWEVHQMDVKTAFLYGNVQENIYVKQPTGYAGTDISKVCKLRKALYGLKQSSHIWYHTLAQFLMSLGLKAINADLSVFAKKGVIIAIYVDDLLLTGSSMDEINKLKLALSQKFHMTDLGLCSYYLGMAVTRDRQNRTLRLSQREIGRAHV